MQGDLTIVLSENDKKRFDAIMKGFSTVDQSAAVAKGLKEGMQEIANAGKANLISRNKKRKGKLLKSIGVYVKKKSKSGYAGFKRPSGNAAHLVDMGTAKRYTKKGAYRGSVSKSGPYTGTHFWQDAVYANGSKAVNALINAVITELNKRSKK